MITCLAIFGASGDLTARYLMPALAALHEAGRLPQGFRILGLAREPMDREEFRRRLVEKMRTAAPQVKPDSRDAIVSVTDYRQVNVTDRHELAARLEAITEPIVAYLALPAKLFAPTIEALAARRLPPGSKIVLEKPFGEDLASAQALNKLLHASFPEQDVFRLDHFLGNKTVQNILGLRFANRLFEPVWNFQHVERVDIVWDETLTAAGRAAFYDVTGALKDMIQNHLLQVLAVVAMEPFHYLNERSFRDRKVDVFRAVHRMTPEEVKRYTVRGRYRGGTINGKQVAAYVDEPGVDGRRHTETFAQVTLGIENWRWSGVPFVIRTGKGLGRDRQQIVIRFRPVPHLAFGQQSQPHPNTLTIGLTTDDISLSLNVNAPGDLFDLDQVCMDSQFGAGALPAYSRLLLDILNGDLTLSIRDDEAEECWRIVEPILDAWADEGVPLQDYPAGSEGPSGT
jgi:glucose-6-phosphate 1-dehydrogenase